MAAAASAGNGTGSGTIWIQSGTGILIEQNVIGSSATSYTLPAGSQTQDNVVLITGGGDITIEENLMGFARWRTILFLSPTIGAATVRDNEIKGSFDGIDFANVGIGPSGAVTLTRNYIHDSVDNAQRFDRVRLLRHADRNDGSTSITANTVRNVDVPVSIDSTRPVLVQHNILTGGVFDAVDHISGSEAVTIDRNAISDNLPGDQPGGRRGHSQRRRQIHRLAQRRDGLPRDHGGIGRRRHAVGRGLRGQQPIG